MSDAEPTDKKTTTNYDLTFQEAEIIEFLRFFKKDEALRHLPQVFITRLNILKKRDIKYNRTRSCYQNTFGDGDAEAFINIKRNFERISDIMHNGNHHLECYIPESKFESAEIIEDQGNYSDIWLCDRIERKTRSNE